MGRNVEMLVYKFMTGKSQRITELPIELETLYEVCAMRGWELSTYQEGTSLIEEYKLEYMPDKADGFACRSDYGEIHIFYNGNLSYENKVCTIAHEIGHIALKHTCYKVFGQSEDPEVTAKQEAEANEFMLCYLAPPLVLRQCGISTVQEIEKLTYLNEMDSSVILDKINGDSNSITVDEEQKVIDLFSSFIRKYKVQKRFSGLTKYLHNPMTYVVAALFALCISGSLFAGYMIPRGEIDPQQIIQATESPQPEQTETPPDGQVPADGEIGVPQPPADEQVPDTGSSSSGSNGGTTKPSGGNSSGGSSGGSYSGGGNGGASGGGSAPAQQQPQAPAYQPPAATPYQPPATQAPQPTQQPTAPPATQPPAAARAETPQGQTVWLARTGTKYHIRSDCSYIAGKTDLRTMDISVAIAAGYGPCSRCAK